MAAKFVLPFANAALKRDPTTAERAGGFPCGPADAALFNQLFFQLQAELGHLIEYSGQTDSTEDMQQVRKAIEALIMAAIGGLGEGEEPDLTGFILLSQARQRLPIFPTIATSDNRMNVSSPGSGSILVPPTISILHRGIFPLSTSDFTELERTFATVANKTYHVRMNLAAGAEALTMTDVTNGTYNPGALPETDKAFDTTYDSMLIARVVTNGSNVATITNLRNADRLEDDITGSGTPSPNSANASLLVGTVNYNWGRIPRSWSTEMNLISVRPLREAAAPGSTGFLASDPHDHDEAYTFTTRNRYQTVYSMMRDHSHGMSYEVMVLA